MVYNTHKHYFKGIAMNQGNPRFDRDRMFSFIQRAGALCAEQDVHIEIAIYGGSSIMMHDSAFSASRSTEDIDYIPMMEGKDEFIRNLFNQASQEEGYSEDVFRDDVKHLVSDMPQHDFFAEYPPETGNLRIYRASPEYILAMKAMSMRSGFTSYDPVDVFYLTEELGITDLEGVLEAVEKYFPAHEVPRNYRLVIEDLFEYKAGLDGDEPEDQAIRFIGR